MSDQNIADAKQRAQDQLQSLQGCDQVSSELESIQIYRSRFVLPGRPLDYAERVLNNLMKKSINAVDEEIMKVGEAVAVRLEQIAVDVSEATGTTADPNKPLRPLIEAEWNREIKEQDDEIAEANQALTWITGMSSLLQIPYTTPAPQPASESKKPALWNRVKGVFVAEEQQAVADDVSEEEQSWLSAPKLPMAKDDFTILRTVQETVDLYPNEVSSAKAELQSYGYTDAELSALFARCWKVAADEIATSNQVKDAVTRQVSAWLKEIDGAEQVLDDLALVQNYFHTQVAQS